ncbi:MAG: hypothetical protein L0216_16330 [Planctomycetales bacterium]|nr:hypothetical protein [Planctomycetales bacterium]
MGEAEVRELLDDLKRRSRSRTGALTDEVIAEALGTTVTTVARWRSGKFQPGDEAQLRRLRWLWMQSRMWYLRVMPAVLLMWRPGESLAVKEEAGLKLHHSTYFSAIEAVPRGENVVEYRIALAEDLESMTLMAVGPDRKRIQLGTTLGGSKASHITFWDRRGEALRKGKSVSLFVEYLV